MIWWNSWLWNGSYLCSVLPSPLYFGRIYYKLLISVPFPFPSWRPSLWWRYLLSSSPFPPGYLQQLLRILNIFGMLKPACLYCCVSWVGSRSCVRINNCLRIPPSGLPWSQIAIDGRVCGIVWASAEDCGHFHCFRTSLNKCRIWKS